MKQLSKLVAMLMLVALTMTGCTNFLHNGTEMVISSITVTGLPANPFVEGTQLAFSYNIDGTGVWVHGTQSNLLLPQWVSTVDAKGTWTHAFSTPLVVTSANLEFLLIDPTELWGVFQVDNRIVTGTSYNNVLLPNTWGGASTPVKIVGTVNNGTYVSWSIQ